MTPSPRELIDTFHLRWAAYQMREAMSLLPAISAAGLDSPALLGLAKALYERGRFSEALPLTARAHRLDPGADATAVIHAELLERCDRFEEARETLSPLLARDVPRAVRLEAHLLRREGRFAEASEILERHLHAHPAHPDRWRLLYELAAVRDKLADYPGAMASLLEAKALLKEQTFNHRQDWRVRATFQRKLTQSLTADHLRRWREEYTPSDEPRICVMGGFPRSGTTLLESRLTAHPDCIGTDESGILATQFRDDIIFGSPTPQAALEELEAFDADQLKAGRAEYFRATAEVAGASLAGRLVLEKEPLLTPDLPLPLRLFPSCKLLMPLRDPRDVIVSFFFTIVPLNWSSAASANLRDSAVYFSETLGHWLHLRNILDPACWRESRYENLVADPLGETARLQSFLNLAPQNESDCHGIVSERIMRTPTYDDVRKPVYRASVGRWQRYAQWLEPHLPILEPVVRELGYSL